MQTPQTADQFRLVGYWGKDALESLNTEQLASAAGRNLGGGIFSTAQDPIDTLTFVQNFKAPPDQKFFSIQYACEQGSGAMKIPINGFSNSTETASLMQQSAGNAGFVPGEQMLNLPNGAEAICMKYITVPAGYVPGSNQTTFPVIVVRPKS